MDNQFFSREITINKSFDECYDSLLKMTSIMHKTLISENRTLGKIIFDHAVTKIEARVKKVSDAQTSVTVMILDRNNNYMNANSISSNAAGNFENALAAILDGKPESFKPQSVKIDGVAATGEIISLIAGGIAICYGIYAYFH